MGVLGKAVARHGRRVRGHACLGESLGFKVASIGFLKKASPFGFCFTAGFS
jgi:hypothetical protein